MQVKEALEYVVESTKEPIIDEILELTVPKRDEPYTIDQIESRLHLFRDEVEEFDRSFNDHFDTVLDNDNINKLKNLYQKLHNVQLDVMKLQCEIAFTKEQYDSVGAACNNPLVKERKEMLVLEGNLRRTLQQSKFEPIKEFFEKFAAFLDKTTANWSKLCAYNASNYLQIFDWSHYLSIVSLLQACGKAMVDLDTFERLYQSNVDIIDMKFKQPIDQIDFRNFIELQDSYSLESHLDITLSNNSQSQEYRELLLNPDIKAILDSKEPLNYIVFESLHFKLKSITIDCCKILVDLNMNYIEAHLTDGINIDKLNGNEGVDSSDEQPLPLYALSPQEYITQIGQHLLTLRKQTDQFDGKSNETLKYGLESLQQAQDIPIDTKACASVTDIVMKCIARHCIRSLLGRTNHSILSKLTPKGKRQLSTDALYLDNVLEDLGLLDASEPNVDRFKNLLTH